MRKRGQIKKKRYNPIPKKEKKSESVQIKMPLLEKRKTII